MTPRPSYDLRPFSERLRRVAWRAWKDLGHAAAGKRVTQTVLVAGVQRSGTNMLMETLDRSRHTDVYHETDARAFENYEMRDIGVIQELRARSRAPWFVIKSLCELDRLRLLMDQLAPARGVWIVRDYRDTVNSAVRSFGNFAPQLKRLSRDKSSDGWRGRGMSDETQQILAEVYHPDISEASAAAMMWYYRNVLFFEQGLDSDGRVRVVAYEDLASSPATALPQIFAFLGLPDCSPSIVASIHSKSLRRRPEPDIAPTVQQLCDGLAERFRVLASS